MLNIDVATTVRTFPTHGLHPGYSASECIALALVMMLLVPWLVASVMQRYQLIYSPVSRVWSFPWVGRVTSGANLPGSYTCSQSLGRTLLPNSIAVLVRHGASPNMPDSLRRTNQYQNSVSSSFHHPLKNHLVLNNRWQTTGGPLKRPQFPEMSPRDGTRS